MIGVNFDITAQKQAEQTIREKIEKETLLRQITQQIRETLDLQKIFDTACQEIRQFIQTDRVGIFKFYPDSGYNGGEFVAESVQDGLSSVLLIPVHDHCFGEDYAQRYTEGHCQIINDVLNSDLQDCHKAVLSQFEIRANLVIPLLLGEQLWGLLCIHTCTAPRVWKADEVDLLPQIASQLAIAIQQGDLYNQIQAELITRQQAEEKVILELQRKQLLGEIMQSVRDSFNMTELLVNVTQKIHEILNCDRVIVFRLFPDGKGKIAEESVSEGYSSFKNLSCEDEVWPQEVLDYYWKGIPRIVPDVMNDQWTDCLREYSSQGQIQSKIVAPILQEASKKDVDRWVSSARRDRLWGVLVVHACGKKRVWQDQEAEIVQQIADQLAIAIQQANLFQQLQQEQQKLTQSNQALAHSNEDLARATRLKDEFLANMSHELRTPLNSILGMAEGLQDEVFGIINDQQIHALQTIEKSGLHLLSLINDVLDVAKIESGQIELEYTSIPVNHLCSSSLTFIKQQALQKRIQLETKLAPNLTDLFVDERRIRQVLINLLSNAVKFTPEGGKITLTASQLPPADDATQQHYLRISVLDTGIGIAAENINKLFQPFVQIDSAINRQYTGTGLGLALVKQIVELHGGRVNLTSELGIGSCFTIDLPCEPDTILASSSRMPPMTGQNDSSPTVYEAPLPTPLILLAEDNEANISTVSSYLTAKGYRVISAKNGKEAINLACTESPNLILMDIQMPEMDGLTAIRQLRNDPNFCNIPIIALTAFAMTGDRERCLETGASDYLSKPVRLKELEKMIREHL
jgi:signal transduction histidine kinase